MTTPQPFDAPADPSQSPPPDARTLAVIDDSGLVQLTEAGERSTHQLSTLGEAQGFLAARVIETSRRTGQDVVLEATDPMGSWVFLATPDGRFDNITPTTPQPVIAPEPDRSAEQPVLPHQPAPAGAPVFPDEPAFLVELDAPGQSEQPEPQPRRALPTLDDLLEGRPTPAPGPATIGWQATVRRTSFGVIKPRPSEREMRHRAAVATIQRSLSGPRTVVVVNPKGGASKTTATMLLAATFAAHRGGYTLAWDNNETRGTLGWRAMPSRHTNTAVDLLADLERFQEVRRARVGDLDNYVRSQGAAQFDVLASDEDASASASIDAEAFTALHATLSRFYRILVVDTGNNMRASNWEAAVEAADQLVIVSTLREDTAASAAWLVDGLRSKGHEEKVEQAVTVLSAPSEQADPALTARLHAHFGQLTRAVVQVPHDPALVAGSTIEIARLARTTREAWVHATAAVAAGL